MPLRILLIALTVSAVTNTWLVFLWREAKLVRQSATITAHAQPLVTTPTPVAAPSLLTAPRNETEFTMLRSQLESLGLPPEFVRAALMTTMHRVFRQKQDAVMTPADPNEYWRSPHRRPDDNTEAALRDLQRQWNKMKREFIGDDFDDDPNAQIRRYGNLPPEKVARLKQVLADYSDLEKELYVIDFDSGSPELRALAREKRADLERLLTREELLGYDLRNSPASERLRNRFGNFAATEAEFRELYPTFRAATEDIADPDWNSPSNPNRQLNAREVERHLEAELLRVLGAARFAELKEANDDQLHETRKFTASLNLPPAITSEVITIQKEFAAQLTAIDRNRDLTPNQRDVMASTLGNETRGRLLGLLGPDNLERYQHRGGGWLTTALNRRPSPPARSP